MKNEVIETKKVVLNNGTEIALHYNLVSIDMMIDNKKGKTPAYGIEIEKYQNGAFQEKDFVYAISKDRNKVVNILKRLSKGNVTPVCLIPIVNDMTV